MRRPPIVDQGRGVTGGLQRLERMQKRLGAGDVDGELVGLCLVTADHIGIVEAPQDAKRHEHDEHADDRQRPRHPRRYRELTEHTDSEGDNRSERPPCQLSPQMAQAHVCRLVGQ